MLVRNQLWDKNDYEGHYVDASDELCPCRPCWHVYHFPYWDNTGKMIENFQCCTRGNSGCPNPKPRPFHIFYNSKKFQNRKRGDVFKCLRCGQKVTIGIDDCDWIAVPFRKREKVREFLRNQRKMV